MSTQQSPMDVVGLFLNQVFTSKEISPLPTRLLHSRSSSPSSHLTNILHSAPGFTQSQLIRLILQIYGGPPEVFEVLHCKPATTEQELKIFMRRVTQTLKQPRQYLVLEVNQLPYNLQEVVFGFIVLFLFWLE